MYRGTEKGVGIANSYERIDEAVAYSLVTRMRFLKELLPDDEASYQDAGPAGLSNQPIIAKPNLRVVGNGNESRSGPK
jgi:hypothetical protein